MLTKADLVSFVSGLSDINGRYDSQTPIGGGTGGSGQFSAVFKARQRLDGRPVALKFFVDGTTPDPYRREAFAREGMVLENVFKGDDRFVQLVEQDTLNLPLLLAGTKISVALAVPFLALEWIDGGDARQFVSKTSGRTELLGKLTVFDGMCSSVSRAHSLGCCHRDLKPDNFLLDGGRIKLSDLGTVRAKSIPPLLAQYVAPVGDLRYASPETIFGLPLAEADFLAVDAYSLGVILFELLTGQQIKVGTLGPFALLFHRLMGTPEKDRPRVFAAVVGKVPDSVPNLRLTNPDLPKCAYPLLQRILAALVRFDPKKRETRLSEIRRLIRMCRIVVENEHQYLAMLERRRLRRKGRTS